MGATEAARALRSYGIGTVFLQERMAKHTTFRIGGPATAYVECNSIGDLADAMRVVEQCEAPWAVVGKGSNLLVSDEGYDGVVIALGRGFKTFSVDEESDDGSGIMTCGAGMSLGRLVQEAFRCGYSGFEFAVGIPGSFGGAVFMNAGTSEATIGQVCKSVVVYRPGQGLHRYANADLPWIYRYAGIPKNEIVLEAEIRIRKEPKTQIQARMEGSLARRRKKQPSGFPNAGSVFRNPVGDSAGRLIEQAGFKGKRVGGAMVSDMHANFILNVDNATAQDVLSLMTMIRDRVKELYGTELQPETRFLGFA